jgi:hypothetical protein
MLEAAGCTCRGAATIRTFTYVRRSERGVSMSLIDPYAQIATMCTYPEMDDAALDSVRLRAEVHFA